MRPKALIWIGALVGSSLGGLVPLLWHAGWLSVSSILFGALGGIVGIWAGYRLSRMV